MLSNPTFSRFSNIALLLWLFALTQSVMAMLGVFSVTQSDAERILFGIVELATIALLVLNAIAIKRFVAKHDSLAASYFSKICLYSLLLCAAGDIVNRNFPQLFYQYDNVIKHSYLADSVIFFFPGYLMLAIAIAHFATKSGQSKKLLGITAAITAIMALVTYHDMHLTGVAYLLTLVTAAYSVVVSILAISAIWLIKSLHTYKLPVRIWCAALGLILAMVADAIIGKFWIFGNEGQGYFPLVSHINWIIYFASQALIQQLPLGLLQLKLASKPD